MPVMTTMPDAAVDQCFALPESLTSQPSMTTFYLEKKKGNQDVVKKKKNALAYSFMDLDNSDRGGRWSVAIGLQNQPG